LWVAGEEGIVTFAANAAPGCGQSFVQDSLMIPIHAASDEIQSGLESEEADVAPTSEGDVPIAEQTALLLD